MNVGFMPHLVSVALCVARLAPVAFLCPAFGGVGTPSHVRLGIVLALAMGLHWAGGVGITSAVIDPQVIGSLLRELVLGTAIGLAAALPFDAARMGGRFIDIFRGTNAEAVLPVTGTREAVSGDLLHNLLVALVAASVSFPMIVRSVTHSFALVKLGGTVVTASLALGLAKLATGALGVGFAIGAPIAGAALLIDLLLGFVARVSPQFASAPIAAPAKILAGGAILWLGLGVVAERLLSHVGEMEGTLAALLHAAP